MTLAKICAIIYTVRVPTMEYGGSLNEVKEVIVMQYVTYENLFLFTSMLTGIVTLCYLIFHKKK